MRNRGLGDLPSQRVAIVRCRFRRRGWLTSLADKELTPAPRRILTTSAERPDKITPTIRGGRPYPYGHGPDPTVLASSRQPNFSGAVAGPPQRWQPAPCAPEWPDMYPGLTAKPITLIPRRTADISPPLDSRAVRSVTGGGAPGRWLAPVGRGACEGGGWSCGPV